MKAAMVKFTLHVRPETGVEIPAADAMPPPPDNPGDILLVVERVLEDKHGNQPRPAPWSSVA
jgi:hypothetical protein